MAAAAVLTIAPRHASPHHAPSSSRKGWIPTAAEARKLAASRAAHRRRPKMTTIRCGADSRRAVGGGRLAEEEGGEVRCSRRSSVLSRALPRSLVSRLPEGCLPACVPACLCACVPAAARPAARDAGEMPACRSLARSLLSWVDLCCAVQCSAVQCCCGVLAGRE
jgi:hypothetical protein